MTDVLFKIITYLFEITFIVQKNWNDLKRALKN